jgi:hypothetical protein
MRAVLALVAFGIFLFLSPANAEEAVGRLRAVYYEAAPGVLVESRFAHSRSGIRWADIDVGGRRVLARMPAEVQAGVGERVAVRLADPKSSQLAQVLPTLSTARAFEVPQQSSTGR